MNGLGFHRLETILCLGAHADDIEIGCGGTILQLLKQRPQVKVHWIVFSGDERRQSEARESAEAFLAGCQNKQVDVRDFRDAYFPAQWESLKDQFSKLRQQCEPSLVFTHRLDDRHQDHQVVSQLTWNHFRQHPILEYEIPKYEGDLATPSIYVPLESEMAEHKIRLLERHFFSQQSKPWYDRSTFEGLMRVRGLESGSSSPWAEGFYVRKLNVSF